jgi:hypothetical protein
MFSSSSILISSVAKGLSCFDLAATAGDIFGGGTAKPLGEVDTRWLLNKRCMME